MKYELQKEKNVSNRFYTSSYGSEIIRLLESKKKTEEGFDARVNILEQYKAYFRFPWNHGSVLVQTNCVQFFDNKLKDPHFLCRLCS